MAGFQSLLGIFNPTQYSRPVAQAEPGVTHLERYNDHVRYTDRGDHWTWPYPVATSQYGFFNCWVGNQLPGVEKNPFSQEWSGWYLHYSQMWQEYQRQGDKAFTGQGALETNDVLDAYYAMWNSQNGVI